MSKHYQNTYIHTHRVMCFLGTYRKLYFKLWWRSVRNGMQGKSHVFCCKRCIQSGYEYKKHFTSIERKEMESTQKAGETQGIFFPVVFCNLYSQPALTAKGLLQCTQFTNICKTVHSEIIQTHPTNLYLVPLQATVHLKIQLFWCCILLMLWIIHPPDFFQVLLKGWHTQVFLMYKMFCINTSWF